MTDMVEITTYKDGKFALKFPYNELLVQKAKMMPTRRFVKSEKAWTFPPTLKNFEYLAKWFPDADWCEEAIEAFKEAKHRQSKRERVKTAKEQGALTPEVMDNILQGTKFKTTPYEHQKRALILGRYLESFAYLMDQGTGKTKVLLDDFTFNYNEDNVDALLVICPNSVKTNWVNPKGGRDEVETHLSLEDCSKAVWKSSMNVKEQKEWKKYVKGLEDHRGPHILAVNVEAIHVPRVFEFLSWFCSSRRVMIAADESTRIKNPSAKRTKNAWKLRRLCKMARIMTGTPVIKSPLDAYAQFGFLDEDILGFESFYAFRNRYAICGEFNNPIYYVNTEELSERIASASFRVTKEECLDLPAKTYAKRFVNMSKEQSDAYRDMREEMLVWLEEHEATIEATIILTQLLRLQQITAGFLPVINDEGETISVVPIGKNNPKIQEAIDIIEECNHKVIVWCRFIPEILAMHEACKKNGFDSVTFYGGTSGDDRIAAREAFQDPSNPTKVFIGQVRTGGIGLTLHQARTVIYLSNSFSTEDRVQSEDRAHRIGQEHPVEYIDLICPDTVDVKIVETLRSNKRLSDQVMKDGYKEWI